MSPVPPLNLGFHEIPAARRSRTSQFSGTCPRFRMVQNLLLKSSRMLLLKKSASGVLASLSRTVKGET